MSLMMGNLAVAEGVLSDNQRIESEVLGYALQYRTYVPDGVGRRDRLPVLYITDGQWYISQGELPALLDHEINAGNIEPVIVVFVDSRNPDDLSENRRNQQFFCNSDYVEFFTTELVQKIDSDYRTNATREARTILGLSFGGRNSGCFGLMANDHFAGIAMQSPANTEMVDDLVYEYRLAQKLPIKIFLSVGTINDNTQAGRQLKDILEFKEYDLTYREVNEGHDWDNWRPLLDDVLMTFYSKGSE
jgi:enterochelin esterase-like enzyme